MVSGTSTHTPAWSSSMTQPTCPPSTAMCSAWHPAWCMMGLQRRRAKHRTREIDSTEVGTGGNDGSEDLLVAAEGRKHQSDVVVCVNPCGVRANQTLSCRWRCGDSRRRPAGSAPSQCCRSQGLSNISESASLVDASLRSVHKGAASKPIRCIEQCFATQTYNERCDSPVNIMHAFARWHV